MRSNEGKIVDLSISLFQVCSASMFQRGFVSSPSLAHPHRDISIAEPVSRPGESDTQD